MRRRRVLHVLTYYAPHISGLTEAVRLLAEQQARESDFQPAVLALRHQPDLPESETVGGVEVVRAKPILALHKGMLSADLFGKFKSSCADYDLVHLHLPMLEAGLLSWLTPRHIPLIASYYCDVTPSGKRSVLDWAAVKAVLFSSVRCCRRATRVVVLSRDYAEESPAVAQFSAKFAEVYPSDNAPDGLLPRSAVRQSTAKRIGFLGRFVEEKGIDVLLRAAPLILRRFPEACFVLAGDYQAVPGGSAITDLQAAIRALGDRVILVGKVPYDQLFDFYRSLDVFVLPSINSYEAFGIVQVEAMKAGVPVVASDRRGVRVPVRRTGNGLLVAPGDHEALADAAIALLRRDEETPPSIIAERAWTAFPFGHAGRAMASIYTDVLNEHPDRAKRR